MFSLMIAFVATLLAIVAGLWCIERNVPTFTLGDPIEPDGEDELDGDALRAYAAKVRAATGGQSVEEFVRRRLFLSFACLVLLLAVVAGTHWTAWGLQGT